MMADMMACAEKQEQLCCDDDGFRADVCQPLQFCRIATGEAQYTGPLICPPPQMPDMFGKKGTCKNDDATLKSELSQALQMCMQQLQPLYDLQKDLTECAADVEREEEELEKEKDQVSQISKEGQDCQVKKESEKRDEQTKQLQTSVLKFCPAQTDALNAAVSAWTTQSGICMASEITMPDIVVPDIKIDIPKIDVSFNVPAVDIKVPDFQSPSFNSDIIIPGGGPKLNTPQSQQSQQPPKLPKLEERLATVKGEVQQCEEAKAKIPLAKQQMQQSAKQAQEQKTKMCEESSLVQLNAHDAHASSAGISPEAQIQIQVLQTFKMLPFFSCAASVDALDALIAVLQKC